MPLRSQGGQAIVLIAFMLAILIGMVALAIDGSHGYAVRRDLQAAVDSAALAAGDRLQQTGSYASAEQAATAVFGVNLKLYAAPSCSAYGAPGSSPLTVTCTYADGTVLTDRAAALGPQGASFAISARRSLQLQFANILSTGANPVLGATASAGANNLLYAPALFALGPDGCGTSGSALSVSSSGATLSVTGDVVSNGAISVAAGTLRVAGDIYARCQSTVPGLVGTACYPSGAASPCTYPDVAGATRSGFRLADPAFPAPAVSGGSNPRPGNNVILTPGTYASNPNFNSDACYFLGGGVYGWQGGYSNTAAFVSNELKPPDEPNPNSPRNVSPHQFWNTNGMNCAGSFVVAAIGGNAIPNGTWGIELTSVRSDSFGGSSYTRESAPSICRSVSVATGQVIQVQISNAPGATSYRVYASPPPSACSGPFGLAGSVAVTQSEQNNDTSGCPFGGSVGNGHGRGNGNNGSNCSLGGEDAIFDATALGPLFLPNPLAPPGVVGAYPPDAETPPLSGNLPDQNAARATPPAGDRANENSCANRAGSPAACPAAVTPGAVAFYLPAGSCFVQSNFGDTYVFSGYQYDWVALYEPPSNTCNNTLGADKNSAMIGLYYAPAAAVAVTSADAYDGPATGGLIADTISFTGSLPQVRYDPGYGPVPQATRLTG